MKKNMGLSCVLFLLVFPLVGSANELPKVSGQIVRIELPGKGRTLSLAEVEVFEKGKNVALEKTATQISTAYEGGPERAVDGNSDPDYMNNSVTHTMEGVENPWWEVDLGRTVNVEEILISNRNSHQSRLDGFTLTILDANRKMVFSKENCAQFQKVSFLQPGVKPSQAAKVIKRHIPAGKAFGDPSTEGYAFPGVKTDFRGYDRYDQVKTATGQLSVVCPKNAAPGKPWLWRSLFWEQIPQFSNADLQLVEQGYHVVLAHGDVSGHPNGNKAIDAAYELVTKEYGFAKKCSMASMSRGTLSLFRWATMNPEKVESIYVDNGVCNVLSWPAGYDVPGNNSTSNGDAGSWADFKRKFGYATDAEALLTKESPIDLLEPLAKAGVPILMVCGSQDTAVPYAENDAIMEERYKKLGGSIDVIIENKGHSHGMNDPTPILEFIKKHTVQ